MEEDCHKIRLDSMNTDMRGGKMLEVEGGGDAWGGNSRGREGPWGKRKRWLRKKQVG